MKFALTWQENALRVYNQWRKYNDSAYMLFHVEQASTGQSKNSEIKDQYQTLLHTIGETKNSSLANNMVPVFGKYPDVSCHHPLKIKIIEHFAAKALKAF